MFDEKTIERLEELLNELREYTAEGVPILVEGVDDEKALRELGVKGQIFKVSSGSKTLLNFLEGLADHKQIIILTDFDQAGDRLARFCAKHLRRLGVESIVELREELKTLLHKEVKDVEGLAKAYSRNIPKR